MTSDIKQKSINFSQKLSLFNEHWSPKVIAQMNNYQFKLVKVKGEFVFHNHLDTDETFIVIKGQLRIEFIDGAVDIAAGEMYVVPKGVEHKPIAVEEVEMLLIEPKGIVNTGDQVSSDLTAQNDVWI